MLLGVGVVAAISGCGAVQQAGDTAGSAADTVTGAVAAAEVCSDALALVANPPDLSAPQAALDQAHTTATELTDLVATTSDTDIGRAITDLAATLQTATLDTLTSAPAAWLQARADQPPRSPPPARPDQVGSRARQEAARDEHRRRPR
ncbi:hypothetical protein BJF85_04105 [Saccharomonospora sp. CUA-673]|nr:hypothetical protein BJF85_04105 [Saccharomonospora sp. CUA-673]